MSGEFDIYEMAIKAEASLRDSRIERARQLAEGNAPSTFRAHDGSPFRALIGWAMLHARSWTHRPPALQDSAGDSRPATFTNQ